MRGTGSVVFFMVGVGILYFAWNSHVIDAALAFVFNPTQKTLANGPTLGQIVKGA